MLFLSSKNVVWKMLYSWLCFKIFFDWSICTYVSFLAYDSEEQKNLTVCHSGELFEQKGPIYVACQFPIDLLQACSGVNDPEFGYSKGHPCILVKMNRVCTYLWLLLLFSNTLLRSWQLFIKCSLIWELFV